MARDPRSPSREQSWYRFLSSLSYLLRRRRPLLSTRVMIEPGLACLIISPKPTIRKRELGTTPVADHALGAESAADASGPMPRGPCLANDLRGVAVENGTSRVAQWLQIARGRASRRALGSCPS